MITPWLKTCNFPFPWSKILNHGLRPYDLAWPPIPLSLCPSLSIHSIPLDPQVHGGLHMPAFITWFPLSAVPFATSFYLANGSWSATSSEVFPNLWSKFCCPLPLLFSSVASCSFPFQHFSSFVISLYVHPWVYLLNVFLSDSTVSSWRTELGLFTTFSPASKPCLAQRSHPALYWVSEGRKRMSGEIGLQLAKSWSKDSPTHWGTFMSYSTLCRHELCSSKASVFPLDYFYRKKGSKYRDNYWFSLKSLLPITNILLRACCKILGNHRK